MKLRITVEKLSDDHQRVEELESVEIPVELARAYADGLEDMSNQLEEILNAEE